MSKIMTYEELFKEFEALNADAYNCLLDDDFGAFLRVVDDFTNSGVMEQERFEQARRAYRLASMPYTLNGLYIGIDDNNNFLNDVTNRLAGWSIEDLKQRDVYPVYAFLTEAEKLERAESKLADKRIDALREYVKLYKDLYNVPRPTSIFGVPFIDNAKDYQQLYINKVAALAEARSKFHLTFNFKCSSIDNKKLAELSLPKKMDYLTKNFDNIFKSKTLRVEDYFTVQNDDNKLLISNYLQGKDIDRKNWKHFKNKGTLCKNPDFYLQIAFYLAIPSSTEIEKFMNLYGYSIKNNIQVFPLTKKKKDKTDPQQPVIYSDLCRLIDAGIDYELINSLYGFQLESKELKK